MPVPDLESRPIRFVHRGAIVAVQDAPTTQSVLYWLRETAHCVGTKEGCNEGDCGACMVLIAERDADAPDGVALRPANACLQFLSALDGKALITVEDLKRIGPSEAHPAQQAMVDCHGSQCGFCTPGFTMSLAACYDNALANGLLPTRRQLADVLSGNLCRCTGYRPILDAGEAMFDRPEARIDRRVLATLLDTLATDAPLHYRAPESALAAIAAPDDAAWVVAPRSIDDLAALYATHPDARLVAGATDVGLWVTKQFRPMPKTIRVDAVDAMKTIAWHGETLSIGAGASLEAAWSALVELAPALREMQLRFASLPLRLAGTMGGSVANGSPIGDSAPALLALDATLLLRRDRTRRRVALVDFYVDYLKNRLEPGEFVEAIEVPRPIDGTRVRGYKLSKRYDCDVSAVCAGLSVRMQHGRVAQIRIAFGGMAATCRRVEAAETVVLGSPWDEATLDSAVDALARDFAPMTDLRASAAYRKKAAGNLLRRFWMETREAAPLAADRTSVWTIRVDAR